MSLNNHPEEESKEQQLTISAADDHDAGEMKYSPRKFDSMVLGDGSFEALMKERSKVLMFLQLLI